MTTTWTDPSVFATGSGSDLATAFGDVQQGVLGIYQPGVTTAPGTYSVVDSSGNVLGTVTLGQGGAVMSSSPAAGVQAATLQAALTATAPPGSPETVSQWAQAGGTQNASWQASQFSGTASSSSATTAGLSNPTGNDPVYTDQNGNSIDFNSAIDIINSALAIVGLDPSAVATTGANVGQTLGNFFWSQITTQGITDPTTIGDMITTLLPSTGQFQTAFPGYSEALKNGYIRTVADYVAAEEGITAVMLQGGVPTSMINPTTVGNLIAQGNSVNEVAQRVTNGLDVALNAPAEVQNFFAQEFGAGSGTAALATVFLNPNIDPVTLQKMLAGAQIRGAAAASNLTVSQGLSQRLADMGQTYSSAQSKFQNLTNQAGLFEQTVGEQSSQAPVAGTQNQNSPLAMSNQGVEAEFGLSANASQQVEQASLARQNAFKGGGGASQTTQEGYSGLAEAKPF